MGADSGNLLTSSFVLSPSLIAVRFSLLAFPLRGDFQRNDQGMEKSEQRELVIALAEEVTDCGVGRTQRFFIGQEDDAEMFGARALTEA